MTSLAALAQAGHPKAPPFNGLFYATAATVIPVLFLALAVQGPTYANLLTAIRNFIRLVTGSAGDLAEEPRPVVTGMPVMVVAMFALPIAMGTLGVSVVGEVQALIALYQQRAPGPAPLISAVILTIIAAGAPAVRLVKIFAEPFAGTLKGADRHPGRPGQQHPNASSAEAPGEPGPPPAGPPDPGTGPP